MACVLADRSPIRRVAAFTLIELLVVVSTVALLVSLLLPAMGKAREASKRSVCLSNQRQLGMGLFMYADDNRGAFPLSSYGLAGGSFAMLFPKYVRSPVAYWCPSTTYTKPPVTVTEWGGDGFGEGEIEAGVPVTSCRVSYDIAGYDSLGFQGVVDYGTNPRCFRMQEIMAQKRALLWDLVGANNYYLPYDKRCNHRGLGGNVYWYDGHAAWREPTRWFLTGFWTHPQR